MQLAASAPSSLAAQYLGVLLTVGRLGRQAPGVHDLGRDMRRQLGRRLARSLAGSTNQRLEQPPPPRDGRRLSSGAGETTSVTLSEMLYLDESTIDADFNATLTGDGIDFDFNSERTR